MSAYHPPPATTLLCRLAKLHGPCSNPACNASEAPGLDLRSVFMLPPCSATDAYRLFVVLCSMYPILLLGAVAPEGSGVEGAICQRCYGYQHRTGSLPDFPK